MVSKAALQRDAQGKGHSMQRKPSAQTLVEKLNVWRTNVRKTSIASGDCRGSIVGNGVCLCRFFECGPLDLSEILFICDISKIESLCFA